MSERDGGGLLSNVFSYVSRELEGFITNATGGAIVVGPRPSTQRRAKKDTKAASVQRSGQNEQEQSRVQRDGQQSDSVLRTSVSMPCTLIPRSPSPEEDHIASRSSTPSIQEIPSSSMIAVPSRTVTSVKTAVEKFRPDADSSILLPKTSPHRLTADNATRIPYSLKGKERALEFEGDASSETRVWGKEQELIAAREEQVRNEMKWEQQDRDEETAVRERLRDKQKIRMLEEEIQRLKEELSRRPMHHFSGIPPPPPAPPPPPPGYASRVSTTSDNLFASARASLKQAPIPKEAPINPPARPKGLGVVPPDKMAAFLNEMKTVRLRKTSSDLYGSRSAGSDTSSSSITLPFTRSTDQEDNVRTGEKRKRFDSGRIGFRGEPDGIPKRRSFGSVESEITVISTRSSARRPSHPTSQIVSSSAAPVSIPPSTPSLTSDNERENETSQDDPPPSTPPPQVQMHEPSIRLQTSRQPEREYIDVNMEDSHPHRHRISSSDAFAKRPPVSPLPTPSPRKPRPPARTSSRSVPTKRTVQVPERSDDEDPLTIRHASPAEVVTSSKHKTVATRQQGSTNSTSHLSRGKKGAQRRKTLDEELKAAVRSKVSKDDLVPDPDSDLDSGMLIGVGSRSKRRGFLAHGGAGGEPVFMGVGYIEGAEDEDESDQDDYEDEYQPRKRSQKAKRSNKR